MHQIQRSGLFSVLSVLRVRDYRIFWSGLMAQVSGQTMFRFTLGWLAFDLTGSPLFLGYVALFQALPTIALTLIGGVLADRYDQRRVILSVQAVSVSVVGLLAFLAISGRIELWHLMVAALLVGASESLENPSRLSLYPLLLQSRSQLPSAVTVFSAVWQVSSIGSPAIAGFAIAYTGAGSSFLISAMTYVVMAMAVRLVRAPGAPRARSASPMETMLEGARYAWREKTLRVLIGLGFFSGVFAFSYMLLLPIFAEDVLHVDARGLGLLASATGTGSIFGTFGTPWLASRFHVGKLLTFELMGMSGLLTAFAFSTSYWLSLGLMPFLGFFAFSSVTLIAISLQMLVSDEFRGRVMALQSLRWTLVPLGAAIMGALADFVGAPVAVATGALSVLAFAALTWALSPEIRALQSVETRRPSRGRPAESRAG